MFQTDRPQVDMRAASFVQEGVRDVGRESFANLLVNLGEQAFEAKVAYDVGKTKGEVTQAIEAYTNQESAANQAVLDAQMKYIQVSEEARFDAEGGYATQPTAEEMQVVNEAKAELARVKKARAAGAIGWVETDARISDILRKGISTMPGRSIEFINAANEARGTYAGNIRLEQERQEALAQSAEAQAKARADQLEFLYKKAINDAGIPPKDSSGNLKPMEQVVQESAMYFANNNIAVAMRQEMAGNTDAKVRSLSDPQTFDIQFSSFLALARSRSKALSGINPETGSPFTDQEREEENNRLLYSTLAEFDRDFGLAADLPQYKTIRAGIEQTFSIGRENYLGNTDLASVERTNSIHAANLQAAINSNPVLSQYEGLRKILGDGEIFQLLVQGGQNDLVQAMYQAVRGLPTRAQGSNTLEEQAATKSNLLVVNALLKKMIGAEIGIDTEEAAVAISNGLLKHWQPDSVENTNGLLEMLSNPAFIEIGPKLSKDSVNNIQSYMEDLITNTLTSGYAEEFDPETMTLIPSAAGIIAVDTGGADPKALARVNAIGYKFKQAVDGVLNLQGKTDKSLTYENFFDVLQKSIQARTFRNIEEQEAADIQRENFWGWIRKGTGTLEGYKATKAKEAAVTNVPSNKKPTLAVGIEYLGYRFKGGDAGDSSNWEKI